jgi:WD40 repeat protein
MSTGPRGEKLIQGMYAFAFSPDGTKIATASPDHNILICDVKSGACLHTFTGHTDMVTTMDWHGDKIISGSEAGEVVLWDLGGFDLNTVDENLDLEVSTLNMAFLKRTDDPLKRVAISEDGSKMMSLAIADGGAGTLTVWRTADSEELRVILDHRGARMRDACFSPDGAYIAIAASDALKIVFIRGDMVVQLVKFPGNHRNVDWKKNHIATTMLHSAGVFVQVWGIAGNIKNGKVTKQIEYSQVDWASDLELSPDSLRVAFTAADSRFLYELDVSTGKRVLSVPHDARVGTVKYSPDGTLICTASDGMPDLHLWDDLLKRRQIIGAAIEAHVEEYEDEDEVRARRMMNSASAEFFQIHKARELINDLRKKLNGYFLPYEIHRYAKEFRLTRGLAEELMENEQVDPIGIEYPEESAGERKSAGGGEPRKRFKRRRRRLKDSIKLRF